MNTKEKLATLEKELLDLKESMKLIQEKFDVFFDTAPNGIMLIDYPTGQSDKIKIKRANKQAHKMHGYTNNELKGLQLERLCGSEVEQLIKNRLLQSMFGLPIVLNLEHRTKTDGLIPVQLTAVFTNKEKADEALLIIKDLTETTTIKCELNKQKERLELSIEGAGLGTWDWDMVNNEMVYNVRWAEMLGYRLDELKGIENTTFKLFSHPKDLEKSTKLVEEHIVNNTDYYECELRMRHKNGQWIWILDRGKIFAKDANGNPLRMSGTHLDITERKQAEAKLLKSKKRNSDLWNAVNKSSLVSITNKKGVIKFANEKFCEVSGYTINELKGQFHSILNSGHHPKEFWEDMWRTILNGEVWRNEVKNIAKDGEYFWVDTVITPITNENGKVTEYLSIRYLITERKKLALNNNELIESLKEYAFQTSHELRSPLANLLGLSQMMVDQQHSNQEVKDIFRMIHDSSSKMDVVIKKMNQALEDANKKDDFLGIRE